MDAESANSEVVNLCEPEEKAVKDINEAEIKPKKQKCCSETARKTIIGLIIMVLLAVSWVGAQQFAQTAVRLHTFSAPYFTTWFGTCWMVLCFPGYCIFVALSQRSKSNFTESVEKSTHIFGPQRVTLVQFFKMIWTLNTLWLAVNYLYIFGLSFIDATDASAIMASNVAFVYILSLCLLNERLYVIRVVASTFCISGVVLLAYTDGFGDKHLLQGVLMIIASAIGAAVYKVVFKKVVGDASLGQVSLFLTLLGISNLLIMWIVSVILYVTGVETFAASDIPWQALNLSSLLGLVFNFLVNFGIAYTYPLFISIAMMMGIPLNAGVDVIVRHGTFGPLRLVAAFLVFAGFAIMLFPDNWNNPIHSALGCKIPDETEGNEKHETEKVKQGNQGESLLERSSRCAEEAF